MQDFPHHYRCVATANADQSRVRVSGHGLDDLITDVPSNSADPAISGPGSAVDRNRCGLLCADFWWQRPHELRGTRSTATRRAPGARRPRWSTSIGRAHQRANELEEEKVLRVLKKAEETCLITNS